MTTASLQPSPSSVLSRGFIARPARRGPTPADGVASVSVRDTWVVSIPVPCLTVAQLTAGQGKVCFTG
jgi:hypothetical protein